MWKSNKLELFYDEENLILNLRTVAMRFTLGRGGTTDRQSCKPERCSRIC
jgi:hypothetical protein